jgi:hypothetical protein
MGRMGWGGRRVPTSGLLFVGGAGPILGRAYLRLVAAPLAPPAARIAALWARFLA